MLGHTTRSVTPSLATCSAQRLRRRSTPSRSMQSSRSTVPRPDRGWRRGRASGGAVTALDRDTCVPRRAIVASSPSRVCRKIERACIGHSRRSRMTDSCGGSCGNRATLAGTPWLSGIRAEERLDRTQEVSGSSPLSSTLRNPCVCGYFVVRSRRGDSLGWARSRAPATFPQLFVCFRMSLRCAHVPVTSQSSEANWLKYGGVGRSIRSIEQVTAWTTVVEVPGTAAAGTVVAQHTRRQPGTQGARPCSSTSRRVRATHQLPGHCRLGRGSLGNVTRWRRIFPRLTVIDDDL